MKPPVPRATISAAAESAAPQSLAPSRLHERSAAGPQEDSAMIGHGESPAQTWKYELDGALALERILAVQQEIAATQMDLQAVMNLIAERARALTGADSSVIELVDGTDVLCRAAAGAASALLGTRLPINSSLSGLAVRRRALVTSSDTETDPEVNLAAARFMQARSVIVAPLAYGDEVIGVLKVMFNRTDAFGKHDIHNLQLLVVSLGAVIQRHRDAEQLQYSESQYRLLFENNPQPMLIHDLPGLRVLAVNQAAVEHYGYGEVDFLQLNLRDLCQPDQVGALELAVAGGGVHDRRHTLWRHRKKDGAEIDMEIASHDVDFNGRRARMLLATDVTDRLRAERELARMSRAQQMLSACNDAMIRAADQISLLTEICRIAVEIGGYRLAWAGFALEDEACTIVPAAHWGSDMAYLRSLHISWSDKVASGKGAAGRAVRNGCITVIDDLIAEPSYQPWAGRAREQGYRGVRSLPLKGGGRTFGVLNLYTVDSVSSSADEIKLLLAMADNLAFGVINLRAREEAQRLQTAVLKVATGVSASTGTAFFEQLVRNMAEALEAEIGFVAHLLPGEPLSARMIAMVVDGQAQPNVDYPVDGSPSENLVRHGQCAMPDNLARDYPHSPLAKYGARAYIGRLLNNGAGRPVGFLCVAFRRPLLETAFVSSTLQIFAARAAAELDRQQADARIRDQASLLDKAQDAIIVRDMDDQVVYWNKSAERLYGWSAAEAEGRSLTQMVSGSPQTSADAWARVLSLGEWTGEIVQRHKDGSLFSIEGRWTLIRDQHGQPQSIFEINTDITERKAAEKEIQHLAFYDALTRLPNRLLLQNRLQHALASCARSRHHGALLFIDLDNFKTLNDTLGHDQGDLLLQEVALRLTACVREVDTLARLGGDEFVVMLEDLSERLPEAIAQTTVIGEKILAALNQPYLFPAYQHHSTASIGVTLFNDLHDHVGDLLKRADLAMYQAKAAGRNTMRFFDPQMQKLATERVLLETDLRAGLQQSQFSLHYQPQVDHAGRVIGVEALLRWQHPQRGMVSPLFFIGLAEETGLILPLGLWVLETACSQLARWAGRPERAHLHIAINVSARQFRHPDFVDQVLHVLEKCRVNPQLLKLELTESLLLDNVEETIAKMSTLKARGVGFALDDFGTGYSSLSYLKRLPLDQLKIDQSFVRDVLTDPNDEAIARTIIALGHSLGLSVMAEGVETKAQRRFLNTHRCDAYQGYLFSKPLAIEALEEFMQDGKVKF